jgi:hypothetical protein
MPFRSAPTRFSALLWSKFGMKLDPRRCLLQLSRLELFGTRIHVMVAPFSALTVTSSPSSKLSICTDVLRTAVTVGAGAADPTAARAEAGISTNRIVFNFGVVVIFVFFVSLDRHVYSCIHAKGGLLCDETPARYLVIILIDILQQSGSFECLVFEGPSGERRIATTL